MTAFPGDTDRLARHTDELVVIAHWKDELVAKINRAHMRDRYADHEERERITYEVEALADDLQDFKKLCRAFLEQTPTGRAA